MYEFVEVSKKFYRDFIKWGNENIEGFHYEVIMVADRTVFKNKNGEMLAYRNLAYEETCHIRKDIYNGLWEMR